MAVTQVPTGHSLTRPTRPAERRTMSGLIWQRFRRHRLSMIAAVVVVALIALAILAPWVAPYSYSRADFTAIYQGPTWAHWFGTDADGRDMLSRIIWSLRDACTVGFGAEAVEVTLGLFLGAIAGYFGGVVDDVIMRLVDIMYGFPSYLFAVIITSVFGRGIGMVLLAIALTSWVGMARVARGQVLQTKQSAYVEAARALGASWWQVLTRYVIPNSLGPVIVAVTFGIPANMMVESALSLIGLGIQPPRPSWGALITSGQEAVIGYPYLLIFPAVTFAVTLLAFTYLGDGLREAFDPRGD